MLTSLEILQSAQAMARHAAGQQSVVAKNIANADTPNFKAMMLPERPGSEGAPFPQMTSRATRAGHFSMGADLTSLKPVEDPDAQMSPNGNSVSVEMEILKSIEAERAHSRAMTVYQSALTILRTSIGRGR